MCLMLDQFLWGHSSHVCDISCSPCVCQSVHTHQWILVWHFKFLKFTGICWVLTLSWLLFLTQESNLRTSVCLSVTKSCPLSNLKTDRDTCIAMKLCTPEKHIQTTCHAQEPEICFGYFWSYFPLIICDAISCPLYNLITVRGISTKLNTFVKYIQTTCHAQEP